MKSGVFKTTSIFGNSYESNPSLEEDVFTLRKKDDCLVKFVLEYDHFGGVSCKIVESKGTPYTLPWSLDLTKEGSLLSWLNNRFVPKNRAFVEQIMNTIGSTKLSDLLNVTLGLSLTDDYWVTRDGLNLKWKNHNLFTNQFSETLSLIAFTGHGSELVNGISSSPEFTTDGMLRKCWRRINDTVYLYKGGTEGYANAGKEPYSEYYSSQIAEVLELNSVYYDLVKWKGVLCSTCELFTSESKSLVPASVVYGDKRPFDILTGADSRTKNDLLDMLMFDAVILNCDRHFNNFGFLRDNNTGVLECLAPIYDHGISLLNYAMDDDLVDVGTYLASKEVTFARLPPHSLDIISSLLTSDQRSRLRRLVDFEFKKHPTYNLDDNRLRKIGSVVRKRANALLKGKQLNEY